MIAVRTQFSQADLGDRADLRDCGDAIERGGAAVRRRYNRDADARRPLERVAELEDDRRRADYDQVDAATGGCSWARSARATTSSRSRSTRTTGCGCSCTRARAASATRSRRSTSPSPRSSAQRVGIELPDRDLAYLAEGTDEFDAYIRDLRWAQKFALLNREEMMDRVVGLPRRRGSASRSRSRAHQLPPQLHRSGRSTSASEVWLSRKGAIEARAGQPGLIPGSMGTASYVVVGKGDRAVDELLAARRRAATSRGQGPQDVHPGAAARGDGGHRVPRHRRVPRRDPGGVQGHRPGHGRRGATWWRSGTRCARS